MKKLIETALPLREITASSIEEKVRKGHPGNLHLWWNRSPIVSSSVLIYAAMTDEDQDSEKRNNQIALLKKLAHNDATAFEQATACIAKPKIACYLGWFFGLWRHPPGLRKTWGVGIRRGYKPGCFPAYKSRC